MRHTNRSLPILVISSSGCPPPQCYLVGALRFSRMLASSSTPAHIEHLVELVQPLSQRITAAPHRDVSHIPFGELLRLYVGGHRRSAAASVPPGGSSPPTSDILQNYDRVFNEWCFRSVLSTNWKDVDVDVAGLLASTEQKQDATSIVSLTQLSRWGSAPSLLFQKGSSSEAAPGGEGDDDDAAAAAASVLTSSTFVGALRSYHRLHTSQHVGETDDASAAAAVEGANHPPRAAKKAPAAPLVRLSGVKRLEDVLSSIRDAPPTTSPQSLKRTSSNNISGSAEGTTQQSNSSLQMAADESDLFVKQRPRAPTVWVPFSTLMDIRQCAFSSHAGAGKLGPHRTSPHDTVSLVGALQLVRQAVSLQHVAWQNADALRPPVIRLVPPSVELRSILEILRMRQRVTTSTSEASTGRPIGRSKDIDGGFDAEVLCESSLVRWCALSRLATSSSRNPSFTCSLVVEGSVERRIAAELGDASLGVTLPHRSVSFDQGHKPHHRRSAGMHRSVVTRIGDLSRKLGKREQHVMGVPRY